jgi:hypothetical protein
VAQEESRTEKTAKKYLSSLLALFAGDGRLKMSNNAAERAILAIALGRKIFLLVPTPEDGARRSSPPHQECRRRSSSSSREARPKTIMAIGSPFHFACQIPRTRKPCGQAPRPSKPTPWSRNAAEFHGRLARA